MIGGLTEEANKRAKFSVGRTLCRSGRPAMRTGIFETILIFKYDLGFAEQRGGRPAQLCADKV